MRSLCRAQLIISVIFIQGCQTNLTRHTHTHTSPHSPTCLHFRCACVWVRVWRVFSSVRFASSWNSPGHCERRLRQTASVKYCIISSHLLASSRLQRATLPSSSSSGQARAGPSHAIRRQAAKVARNAPALALPLALALGLSCACPVPLLDLLWCVKCPKKRTHTRHLSKTVKQERI